MKLQEHSIVNDNDHVCKTWVKFVLKHMILFQSVLNSDTFLQTLFRERFLWLRYGEISRFDYWKQNQKSSWGRHLIAQRECPPPRPLPEFNTGSNLKKNINVHGPWHWWSTVPETSWKLYCHFLWSCVESMRKISSSINGSKIDCITWSKQTFRNENRYQTKFNKNCKNKYDFILYW